MSTHKINYILHRNMSLPNTAIQEHHFKIEGRDLLNINTKLNVRDDLEKDSNVARAIKATLEDNAGMFHILNGGITIVADHISISNDNNTIELRNPSIINGAQSQGVLRREQFKDLLNDCSVPVSVNVLITSNAEVVSDITVARNTQTAVKTASIMGAKLMFDELKTSLESSINGFTLPIKESDYGTLAPTKVAQLLFLALPDTLKVRTYSSSAPYTSTSKWLTEFKLLWQMSHGEVVSNKYSNADINKGARAYQFFLDNCGTIITLYLLWKNNYAPYKSYTHKMFGKGDKKTIPDGLLFPILNSIYRHLFINKKTYVSSKVEQEIMVSLMDFYSIIADPQKTGKNQGVYESLWRGTKNLKN